MLKYNWAIPVYYSLKCKVYTIYNVCIIFLTNVCKIFLIIHLLNLSKPIIVMILFASYVFCQVKLLTLYLNLYVFLLFSICFSPSHVSFYFPITSLSSWNCVIINKVLKLPILKFTSRNISLDFNLKIYQFLMNHIDQSVAIHLLASR